MNKFLRNVSLAVLLTAATTAAHAQLTLSQLLAGQTIADEWHASGDFSGDLASAMGWFDLSYANFNQFVNFGLSSGTPILPDAPDPGAVYTDVFLGSDASAIIAPGAPGAFIVGASTEFDFDFGVGSFSSRDGSAVIGLSTSLSWDDLIYAASYQTALTSSNGGANVTGSWSADIYRFDTAMAPVPEPATYGAIGALALIGAIAQRRLRGPAKTVAS